MKDYLDRHKLLAQLKNDDFGKPSLLTTDWYHSVKQVALFQQQKALELQRQQQAVRGGGIQRPPIPPSASVPLHTPSKTIPTSGDNPTTSPGRNIPTHPKTPGTAKAPEPTPSTAAVSTSPIRIKCSSCGTILAIPDHVVGQSIQCSACGSIFQTERTSSSGERVKAVLIKAVKIPLLVCVLLLFTGVGLAWWRVDSESRKLDAAPKGFVQEILSKHHLNVVEISTGWTDKPTVLKMIRSFGEQDIPSASGTISIKVIAAEKLYRSVDTEDGLRELGYGNLREEEFNTTTRRFQALPVSYQNELRDALPKDPSQFRFYGVLVPEGEEMTLTGNIELIKDDDKDWKKLDIHIDPFPFGNDFIPEPQLQNVHKLDNPATEVAVKALLQARSDFINKVNEAVADVKNRDEIAIKAIKTRLFSPLLEGFDDSGFSVQWTTEGTSSASGAFSTKTRAKGKLYQPVDVETGSRELSIIVVHASEFDALREKIERLPEPHRTALTKKYKEISELNSLKFYRLFVPKGGDVTRTGSIELTKDASMKWTAKTHLDSSDDFVGESDLGDDVAKLDDPKTRDTLESILRDGRYLADQLKLISGFEKFCKPGMVYEGVFLAFNGKCRVLVAFEEDEGNANLAVAGKITFFYPEGKVERPFSIGVIFTEGIKCAIAGEIDNESLPGLTGFLNSVGPMSQKQRAAGRLFYSTMERYAPIDVQFMDGGMFFFVKRVEGEASLQDAPDKLSIALKARKSGSSPASGK